MGLTVHLPICSLCDDFDMHAFLDFGKGKLILK